MLWALFLVGLNLRTAMASLPPLLADVQRDLGLTTAAAGLLTGLPVACMGLAAPAAHRLARATSNHAAATLALGALTGGLALRLLGATRPILYAATLLAGLGIAVLGTVLPGIVKERFPRRPGAATAVYAGAMTLGSALAAGLAVPLAALLGGWSRSLAFWALPAGATFAIWLGAARHASPATPTGRRPAGLPWRSRSAWLVSGYLTAQATLFYSCLAWIAPAYVARGWRPAEAGLLLSAFGAAQLVATLATPVASDRLRTRRPLLLTAAAATAVGLAGLIVFPDLAPYGLVSVLGAGLGAGFALGLLLLVDHASAPAGSTRLSAMAFLVSYTIAAWGPILTGALRDATASFRAPLIALLAVSVAQLAIASRLATVPDHGCVTPLSP